MVSERRFRRALRWCAAVVLCGAVQLVSPTPAYAFWEWLDNLSGPGKWQGIGSDTTVVCFAPTVSWADAANATVSAYKIVDPSLPQSTLTYWRTKYAMNPEAMLKAADEVTNYKSQVTNPNAVGALSRAADLWHRAAEDSHVSFLPGFPNLYDSTCLDKPLGFPTLTRKEREPAPGLVIRVGRFTLFSPYSVENSSFEKNEQISLWVLEPRFSLPFPWGRKVREVLDLKTGAGRYWVRSDGINQTVSGWIIDPIQFNLHFPARWVDEGPFKAVLSSLSTTSGFTVFPGGFTANDFNANRELKGNDWIFNWGVQINLSRVAFRSP